VIIERRAIGRNGGAARGHVIDPGEPTASIGPTVQRQPPIVATRDASNSPHFDKKDNSRRQRLLQIHDKTIEFREKFIAGVMRLGVEEWAETLAKTKPETALNFLSKIMPKDMDIPTETEERRPIVIIQAANANIQVNSSSSG